MRVTYKGTAYDLPEFGISDGVAFERQFRIPFSVMQPVRLWNEDGTPKMVPVVDDDGKPKTNRGKPVLEQEIVQKDGVLLEHTAFLAWRGLNKLGVPVGPFADDFIEGLESVEDSAEETESPEGPTGSSKGA